MPWINWNRIEQRPEKNSRKKPSREKSGQESKSHHIPRRLKNEHLLTCLNLIIESLVREVNRLYGCIELAARSGFPLETSARNKMQAGDDLICLRRNSGIARPSIFTFATQNGRRMKRVRQRRK